MSKTPAEKAFYVLRRNLNDSDLRQLCNIIGLYLEEKWQSDLIKEIQKEEQAGERA